MPIEQAKLSLIRSFLNKNADAIESLATKNHKKFLGGENLRRGIIDKYQENHLKVIEEFANNLESKDLKKGTKVFMKLAQTLAKDSVRNRLHIEEAVNGIIFLKQAVWQMLD